MAVNPLGLCLSPQPKLCFGYSTNLKLGVRRSDFWNIRRRGILFPKCQFSCLRWRSTSNFVIFNSLETKLVHDNLHFQTPKQRLKDSPVLLDVSGMMCGGCVS